MLEECHQKTKIEIRFSDFTDTGKTIFRYHQLLYSALFFKKRSKCSNVYDTHKSKKRPDGTHSITLDDEADINECYDDDLDEFETWLQTVEKKDMLNKSFRIIGISPLKTHAFSKTTKIKAACDKLERSF